MSRWAAGRPLWAPRASTPGKKHTRWSILGEKRDPFFSPIKASFEGSE